MTRPIILIDFDGPLVDVSPRYQYLHESTLKALGHKSLDPSVYWNLKRDQTSERTIAGLVGAEAVAEEYVVAREAVIETESMVDHDKLQPGSLDALDFLANHGDLVLVTLRTRRDLLEQQLARWNLASRFSLVISGDSGIKPRWLIKQRMVKDALPDRKILAIIGDTETDILAGKALGCTTIAVLNGIRNRDRLLNTQPDFILPSLASVGAEELLRAHQVLHIAPRETENRRPAATP